MMLTIYPVLVRRNDHNEVVGYFYPDFDFEYTRPEVERHNLSEEVTEVLRNHIVTQYQINPIPFPKSAQYYDDLVSANANDHWVQCQIDDKNFVKKWERFLPPFGVFSSIMTAITMAIIDFATTKATVKSNSGVWIGIFGAIFSAMMAVIIYYFSDAGKISKIIGRKLDSGKLLSRSTERSPTGTLVSNVTNHHKKKIAKLCMTTIPVATTAFTSYSHYTQVMSIINNDLKDNDATLAMVLKYVSFLMIIFSSYSKLVFQLSFMPPVYEKVDKFTDKCMAVVPKISFFGQRRLARGQTQNALQLARLHAPNRKDHINAKHEQGDIPHSSRGQAKVLLKCSLL